MDSLFWNATLRMTDPSAAMNSVGNLEILNQGILALSLSGNQIQGSQLSVLGRALKRNSWLTGLLSFLFQIFAHLIFFNGYLGGRNKFE